MQPVSLTSQAGTIDFGAGLHLRLGATGFGLPPIQAQFLDGAGDGTVWRGSRVLGRVLDLPLKFLDVDPNRTRALVSQVARILSPTAGLTRIAVEVAGTVWWVDATRTGGGDWKYGADTDGATILHTTISMKAEEAYWTRQDEQVTVFTPGNVTTGLLGDPGSMVGMMLSDSTALGEVTFDNPGDVEAWPVWTITAPFDGFELVAPDGERIEWTGALKSSGYVTVDTRAGTVEDETGANLYPGLNDVPVFWPIPAGTTVGTVEASAPGVGTSIRCAYQPRQWVVL